MTKKVLAAIIVFMLALAMPMGAAFGLDSPKLDSPKLDSPKLDSPKLDSPKLDSPKLDSPKLDSPKLDSPQLDSPKLDSPQLDSPKLDSTAQNASNTTANTIAENKVATLASPSAETGMVMSPSSGALNLALIAGITVFAILGAIAGSAALLVVLRKH